MLPLALSDLRHLEAAKGWCALDAYLDANEELEQITPECRAHPDVLEIRWQVYANLGKWDGALEVAKALMRATPEKVQGYLYTASSLQAMDCREEAIRILLLAAERFPQDEIVPYDLACVCCMLGRVDEAQGWLAKAIELGGDEMKARALDDPDLEPLWRWREKGGAGVQ